MASLPSNFERHSLPVPLGACVTPHSSMSLPTDVRTLQFFIRLISTCSNILGGRFHRLPSVDNIVVEKRCWGDPRGCVPLVAGRKSEKGRQRVRESKRALEGGRRSAFPSKEVRVRLNLQGRSFHSRVFYPHNLEENLKVLLPY
jgi:hypothetical protein